MAIGKEAHEFFVGRPEGKGSALGALEFPGRQVVEELPPNRVTPLLVAGAKRYRRDVGRDRGWAGKVAGEVEAHLRRWGQIRSHCSRRRELAQIRPDKDRQQRRGHRNPYQTLVPAAAKIDRRRRADAGTAARDPAKLPTKRGGILPARFGVLRKTLLDDVI